MYKNQSKGYVQLDKYIRSYLLTVKYKIISIKTFSVRENSVYGLLGSNGAGKSITLKQYIVLYN